MRFGISALTAALALTLACSSPESGSPDADAGRIDASVGDSALTDAVAPVRDAAVPPTDAALPSDAVPPDAIPPDAAPNDAGACDAERCGPPSLADNVLHPEPPAILRDVSLINDDVEFTRAYVPAHRTTMDGRVGVRIQGGPPGTDSIRQNLSFFLYAPERLEAPLLPGPPGPELLADPTPFDVPFPPALVPRIDRLGHHAICDPTLPFPTPGERPNPFPCGPNEADDCYAITIISSTAVDLAARLWGTPVVVQVAQPKTPDAHIVDVTLGESVPGVEIAATLEFMEPAVTRDGRLLTGRLGRFPRPWIHPQTGERFDRPYDLVYFQLPDDAAPCDVTGWTQFNPISHAPYDPRMVGRYGLAAYPFRDNWGELIPDGEDLGGTYPWVDREGANVFMTGIHGTIAEQSPARYPRRCVTPGCESYRENVDWDRGFMMAGLWSHGKFVVLDGMINNMDWAVGVSPQTHWWVDLYRQPDGTALPIRFGAGRFIDRFRNAGGPYPPGYTHNANILDSLQQLLNHRPEARTVTPRDVVWVMSTGVATEEIAFDDFMDPDALIVSNMQASITQHALDDGRKLGIPRHHNGQVRTLLNPELPVLVRYPLDPDTEEDIHLQNAATSLRWRVARSGWVRAGQGRVEPVALGGVEGKGFWLSGEAEIRYDLPAQERDLTEHPLYFGLFVDARARDDARRGLLRFPDGTAIHLRDSGAGAELAYVSGEDTLHTVAIPPAQGWRHLAWRVAPGHREITLLVDGFALDRFDSPTPLFVPHEGPLLVAPPGADGRRARGWLDDFKLIARALDPEITCNHARGTLVRVDEHPEWAARAARAPEWAHAEVAAAAGQAEGARFVCHHDYRADYAAHLRNPPPGTVPMRHAILFPEGPIRAGAPRPDSTANPFCLSCHTAEAKGGLHLRALDFRPGLLAEHDPRRQPDQPPRRVFGNIPAGWIPPADGPGSPAEALRAPPEGLLIDPWLLPPADGR